MLWILRRFFKMMWTILIIVSVMYILTGCSSSGSSPIDEVKKYNVNIKAVNSNGDIIENTEITVNGNTGSVNNGIHTFKLKKGDYTAKGVDPEGIYTQSSTSFVVEGDTTVTLHMFKNYKNVSMKTLKEGGSQLDRAEIVIQGEDGTKENGVYSYPLEVGEEYTATITDPQGFFSEEQKTFTVTKDTDIVEVTLPKAPTGTVTGTLHLSSQYDSSNITYADVNYYSKNVKSGKTGFSIELPEGQREITINTLFGGTVTKSVNVQANSTTATDITVPIPDDFPLSKFKDIKTEQNVVLKRWNKRKINYYIGMTDYIKNNSSDFYKELYTEVIVEGVNVIDRMMEDTVNYNRVYEPTTADVKLIICDDSNSILGGGKAVLHDQQFNNNEVIYSEIYVSNLHIDSYSTGPIYPAHELGHSLSFGHSSDVEDLMYDNPNPILDNVESGQTDDKMIFGLVYSLEFGSTNPFTN